MHIHKYDQKFGENLQNLRRRKNLTQQELGERIGIGHSSISLWEKGERSPSVSQVYQLCRALGCSPGEMLDLKPPSTQEQGINLRWITNFPNSNSLDYTENILDGIHLFQNIAARGFDFTHLTKLESFSNLNPQQLRNKINAAFLARGIEMIDVERDHRRENVLKEKYHLLHCIVARLDGLVEDNIVDVPIRSEAVAFLAAKYCVPLMRGIESVGMSGGQPVVRFFDLIPPYSQDLSGITWHSLLATQSQLSVAPMGGSANGIISRLLYSQPHTKGYAMPFINRIRRSLDYYRSCREEEKEELEYITSTRRKATYVQAAFLSVGTPHFDYMTTATEAVNPELVELMAQLTEHDRKSCQGDILLRLLDESGKRVGSEIDQQMNEALVYSIHLDDLRTMVNTKKQVWVLSESRQKAKMIRAVMLSGLVNCLVIENGIADELIAQD